MSVIHKAPGNPSRKALEKPKESVMESSAEKEKV